MRRRRFLQHVGASLWLVIGARAWAQDDASSTASDEGEPLVDDSLLVPEPVELPPTHPVPGVSAVEVRVGLAGSFTGAVAASSSARDTLRGSLAWLNEVNAQGGIRGRQIQLLAQDDGGVDSRAVLSLQRVLDDPGVFCLINHAGPATLPSVLPTLHGRRDDDVLLFGHGSGAELARNSPFAHHVVSVGASHRQQLRALVERLRRPADSVAMPGVGAPGVGAPGVERIGVYAPLDGEGRSVVQSVVAAVVESEARSKISPSIQVIEASYRRAGDAAPPLSVLERFADLDTLIVCGATEPCVRLIESLESRLDGRRLRVGCVALDDGQAVAARLSGARRDDDILASRAVPSLERRDLPAVDDYVRLTERWRPRVSSQLGGDGKPSSHVSSAGLHAFLGARLLTLALERCGAWPTRRKLLAAVDALGGVDLGLDVPLDVHLGVEPPRDELHGRQAFDRAYVSRLDAGQWLDIDSIARPSVDALDERPVDLSAPDPALELDAPGAREQSVGTEPSEGSSAVASDVPPTASPTASPTTASLTTALLTEG